MLPLPLLQDDNTVERTFGDTTAKLRYSHMDLVYMVDGVDMQRGTITAGNRCYYLKVSGDSGLSAGLSSLWREEGGVLSM